MMTQADLNEYSIQQTKVIKYVIKKYNKLKCFDEASKLYDATLREMQKSLTAYDDMNIDQKLRFECEVILSRVNNYEENQGEGDYDENEGAGYYAII